MAVPPSPDGIAGAGVVEEPNGDTQGPAGPNEAPSAACNTGATPYRRNQMKTARAAVKVCAKAEIIGVAFFDFFHHQTGVAPNEIELHPILKFDCLST